MISSLKRILVTGAEGQLGLSIVREFSRSYDVIPLTRQQLDVSNQKVVGRMVDKFWPSVIINCAAYNNVDRAEEESVPALAVNAFAVRSLAQAATAVGAIFVHYSTDFVFDGTATQPYSEDQLPNPKSVYAASKLLGEWFARDTHPHYLFRVESLFGSLADNISSKVEHVKRVGSLDQLVKAICYGTEAKVFTDRIVSPSYVDDVAKATRAAIEHEVEEGLYHCVNSGMTTWFDLAQEMERQLDRKIKLVPISLADTKLRADRPKFCALSNAKLASVGIMMPSWQDALKRYLASLELKP